MQLTSDAMTPSSRSRSVGSTSQSTAATPTTLDPVVCPACQNSSKRSRLASKHDGGETWIACDSERCGYPWHHFYCVFSQDHDIEMIDRWYCNNCANDQLQTVYRPAPRASNRSTSTIDYKNLNAHLGSDPERWSKVLATKNIIEDHFKEMRAEDMTDEFLYSDASMREPFFFKNAEGLGMTMPPSSITIDEIAQIVGGSTPVEVIDVASQTGMSGWTLQQWANYYRDPKGKIRNVISLEISQSPLAPQVIPPAICRKLDWVERFWPADQEASEECPRVMKYCLMGKKNSYTDFHIDFFGSSVYYHIVRGAKIFYFIRPTEANLAEYKIWSSDAGVQQDVWLGDKCDAVYKIELTAGNTMIIPSGWIHAVVTPEDSLVFGGNFLTSLDISMQLQIHDIEIATKVPRKFRFPHAVQLCWYVAQSYVHLLRSASTPTPISTPSSSSLPAEVSTRILRELKVLSTFLIDQSQRYAKNATGTAERKRVARESAAVVQGDAAALARELRTLVLHALGEESDLLCSEVVLPLMAKKRKVSTDAAAVSSSSLPTPAATVPVPTMEGVTVTSSSSAPSKKRKKVKGTADLPHFKPWSAPDTKPGSVVATRQHIAGTVQPLESTVREEQRVDPLDLARGFQTAQIETRALSERTVMREMREDGSVSLQTTTVYTTVETVRFPVAALAASL